MATAIKVENLSKAYQLGVIGTGTISRDIERWWAIRRGKEDPFLRVGEINDRTVVSESNIVWSLRDINFDIRQGDAVGIIGRNGSGKSTLLKLLSRVTAPTSGVIKIKGRVASLLEVGTGFHPELTGRENIYLNGSILGMRKKEIDRKLDEIIDFSGVEKYVDTPVKRYSSGMYVRLAFAVAANLESEVLIVDEVLAVGDTEFQKKCLGKMKDVGSIQGRTVLFVSHNMAAIQQLCTQSIYLKDGIMQFKGSVNEGMKYYMDSMRSHEGLDALLKQRPTKNKKAYISGFDFIQEDGKGKLRITVFAEAVEPVEKAEVAVGINDEFGVRIVTLHSRFVNQQFDLVQGTNKFTCITENLFLRPGNYYVHIFLGNNYEALDTLTETLPFDIPNYEFYPSGIAPVTLQGSVMVNNQWAIND